MAVALLVVDMRRNVSITIAGTAGAAILPELTRAATDPVIVKKRYSAFFETPLEDLLATLGKPALVVGGVNTHACVRTTVIDAYIDGHIARVWGNPQIIERLRSNADDD